MKLALLTMDDREHRKDYAARVPYFGTAPEALLQGLARMPELEVHIVSCARQRMTSPQKLSGNTFFHSLYVPRIGWMRTFYQGCVRAVRRRLRQIAPDLVHGQGTESYCAISATLSGFPNVVTIHGNMAELARLFQARVGSFGWLAARLENFALRRSGGVFCNSQYTEELVNPRAARTWRVPNALREAFFAPAGPRGRAAKCILVNVGVVSERKRQVELLEVATQLHQQGLDFEFHFIGQVSAGSAYGARFLEKIGPMAEKGFAKYVGLKPPGELIAYFDTAAALVHFPSEESFGLVAAEALARNVKLFGSRVGGLVEIAQGVPDAELFEATDWHGLTSAIAEWISRGFPGPVEAEQVMKTRYHPERVARRHLEIYEEVLQDPAWGRRASNRRAYSARSRSP